MHRILLLVVLGIIHTGCQTQDWPDWRGENRDGVWEASGIVEEFDSEEIELLWSVPIGPGYSGPTECEHKCSHLDWLALDPYQCVLYTKAALDQ